MGNFLIGKVIGDDLKAHPIGKNYADSPVDLSWGALPCSGKLLRNRQLRSSANNILLSKKKDRKPKNKSENCTLLCFAAASSASFAARMSGGSTGGGLKNDL